MASKSQSAICTEAPHLRVQPTTGRIDAARKDDLVFNRLDIAQPDISDFKRAGYAASAACGSIKGTAAIPGNLVKKTRLSIAVPCL
jgi:hypothetical protein